MKARPESSAVSPETVLQFWFGDDPETSVSNKAYSELWWSKRESTDRGIRERFESTVAGAVAGALREWERTAPGLLALILLTDQFPRNMYRETPKSFEFDHLALAWCLTGLEESKDQELLPVQRQFFYLPLEHSESIDHQDRCVRLLERLVAEVQAANQPAFRAFLSYAERHRAVIRKFGRFPHRNAILGRRSTQEEQAFLRTPGSSF